MRQVAMMSAVGVLVLMLLVFQACGEEPAESPQVSELAIQVYGFIENQEWESVRELVTAEFASLSADALANALRQHFIGGLSDEWEVQETSAGFAVARNSEIPIAYVFAKNDEGEWRFDPGPFSLFWAYYAMDPAAANMAIPDFDISREVDGNESPAYYIQERPLFMRLDEDRFVYATQLNRRPTEAPLLVDFNNVQLTVDGEAQDVQLLWTDGVELEPGVFDYSTGGLFYLAMIATDRPVQAGSHVALRFGELRLDGEPGRLTMSLERSFLAQEWRVAR